MWKIGAVMAVANVAGGYVGARTAVARGSRFVRVVFVVVLVAFIVRIGGSVLGLVDADRMARRHRPAAGPRCATLWRRPRPEPPSPRGLGITGAPGAGKTTLVVALLDAVAARTRAWPAGWPTCPWTAST